MGDLFAVAALLLFGANAFVVRAASARAAQQVGFLVALVANIAFGGLLVVVQLMIRDTPLRADYPALGLFALAGVFSSYLGRRGYFRTVQTIGPSRAASIQNSTPAFAFVLAWIFLGEILGLAEILLMTGVLLGLGLVSSANPAEWRLGRRRSERSAEIPLPELGVALLSAAAYAAGNVVRGGAIDRWNEPLVGALIGAVAGTVAYFALHISPRPLAGQVREQPIAGILLWSFSGLITISGQAAVIAATAYLPVALVLAISAATPVVVIPISVLFFGHLERVTARTAVGALLIVVSVVTLLLS